MEETIQIHSNLMYLSDNSSIVSKLPYFFMHCSSCPNGLLVLPHQLSRTYEKSKILKSIFHIKKQDFLKTCLNKVLVKTQNKMIIIKSDRFFNFLMGYNEHFLSLLHLPHFPLQVACDINHPIKVYGATGPVGQRCQIHRFVCVSQTFELVSDIF